VSLCVKFFIAMETNKAFVVSDGIEQLAIPMGVNKVLATMAKEKDVCASCGDDERMPT